MLNKLILTTALVAAGTSGAFAQGFTGGTIGIEYGNFTDIDDASRSTFSGSFEYAINPMIAVALDASFYDFEALSSDVSLSNYTLHGIYKLNDQVNLGAWVGRDVIDGLSAENIEYYGVEAAYTAGAIAAQGYLGQGDTGTQEFTIFGASGAYGFGNGIAAIGAVDFLDIADSGQTFRTIELGGSYEIAAGASVYATVGNLGSDDGPGVDENYYSIGATFSFGPDGGTTFGKRSYLELPIAF